MSSSRQILRKTIQTQRRNLTVSQFQQASREICHHIIDSTWFQQSQHIAFYLSVHNEIDCTTLMQAAENMGKNCYLPVCDLEKSALFFLPYRMNDPLSPNRYGILEPAIPFPSPSSYPATKLDIVITPLVAFDHLKNRLGSGMGYYDRTFAFLQKKNSAPSKPMLIGLAYDFQQVAQLETQPWDIPLNKIIAFDLTAKNVFVVSSSRQKTS